MISRPTVSVVVLNHNYDQYVGRAIGSGFDQEPGAYELTEIVVVDDGSTDSSGQVYARFPSLRVIRTPHRGFGATLTRAVQEAAGDWVALLDADDWFEPHKLSALAPHLAAAPGPHLIQHAERVVDAAGQLIQPHPHPGGSTSTLLVRRRPALDLLPVTNELFFHILADAGHGIRLDEPLTSYRVHQASMTDRRTPGAFQDYMARVCGEVAARLSDLLSRPPSWASRETLAGLERHYLARAVEHSGTARIQRAARDPAHPTAMKQSRR